MEHGVTDEEILAQIPAARARGRHERRRGTRAVDAWYDCGDGVVVVQLRNGAFFGFPPELVQYLHGASEKDLSEVEITPSGDGLHWETLDADLEVSSLLAGIFGNKEWMRELGRAGGRVKSDAKAAAARRNGRLGGRPSKGG
jgi:hypothetical protein